MVLNKIVVEETVALLQSLIQNKCINPPGDELRSIKTIQDYLLKYNIKSQVYKSAKNRGNLIAVIKGTGEGPSLMLGPGHVDVVPIAKPEAWIVDPFEAVIKDGYVWGRGALDMLFIVAAQVQTFVELSKEKFKPKGDLVLVVVSDEEAGGTYGMKWLVDNKPELVTVDYAVSEAGGIPLKGNRLIFCAGEKGIAWRRITFKGTPGHGSGPYKSDNAVVKAGKAAYRLTKYNPPMNTKFIQDFIKGAGMSKIVQKIVGFKPLLRLILPLLHRKSPSMAAMLHALSTITFSPNILHGGIKVNVIPGEAYLDVDIRVLPGQDENYVLLHLHKALGKLAKEAIIEIPKEKGFSSSLGSISVPSQKFLSAIKEAVTDYYPSVKFVPMIATGTTDLRFLRVLGTNAFGFSLFDSEVDLNEIGKMAHGPNEKISLTTIEYTLNTYYKLAKSF